MNKNVLLIGEHFSENLGDGVICQSVAYLIKQQFPNVDLIRSDLSGRLTFMNEYGGQDEFIKRSKFLISKWMHRMLNKHTFFYALYVHGRWKRSATIKRINNQQYDLAIFAGGQLFMDYFSLPIHRHMKYLTKQKTPIVFNACGMGRVNSVLLQKRLQNVLSHQLIESITVRDHLDQINERLLPEVMQATQSHDCALWTSEAFNIQKKDSNTIGLGVISLSNKQDKKVIQLYSDVITALNQKDQQWELFCNGSFEDYELALKIARLNGYDKSFIAKRPLNPTELVQTIANYRSIISFRLHSHIIAVSLDIPTIAITWDNKVDFFFENIQCPDRVFHYDSSFQDILETLFQAEKVGYDTELIASQKKDCRSILISNISPILTSDLSEHKETPLGSNLEL